MRRFIILVITLLFSLLVLPVTRANAAQCPVIYGGGKIDCGTPSPTLTPLPKSNTTQPTPTLKPTSAPAKTKGGLPVHLPKPVKTTPATGPEALGLIGLIPTAAAGFWLRRKTR